MWLSIKNLDIQCLKKTTCIKGSSIKDLPAVISCNRLLVVERLRLSSLWNQIFAADETVTSSASIAPVQIIQMIILGFFGNSEICKKMFPTCYRMLFASW